jgi:hypothetical protein
MYFGRGLWATEQFGPSCVMEESVEELEGLRPFQFEMLLLFVRICSGALERPIIIIDSVWFAHVVPLLRTACSMASTGDIELQRDSMSHIPEI